MGSPQGVQRLALYDHIDDLKLVINHVTVLKRLLCQVQTCDFLRFSKEEKNRIGAHESIWARRGAEQSINTGKSARDE